MWHMICNQNLFETPKPFSLRELERRQLNDSKYFYLTELE